MNRIRRTFGMLAVAGLMAASSALAQAPGDALQPLRVIDTDLPPFPHDMMQIGVREGEVRIAFSVDATGRLEDCLAIFYTNQEFARVSISALHRWKFEPARWRGQAIAASSEVTFNFEVQGTVVVSLTPSETIAARIQPMLAEGDIYRPCSLKELDRIPTPVTAPSPSLPSSLLRNSNLRQVTVSFYIDESGAVRLPSVTATEDPELASVAINALRNWKFEPPTRRGRPVLVRATQLFNFRPPAAAAVSG